MPGWIKLHRKILDNPIFLKPYLFQLFHYCLLKANSEEKKIIWNGKEEIIGKGSFITGRKIMAKEIGQAESATYKRLKTLASLGMISVKSNNRFSVVKVLNYCTYQAKDSGKEQQSNNKVTTEEQQSNTTKNKENKENIKEISIVDFFESIWKLYPKKEGKGQVSKAQKEKLYKIGIEEMARAIDRYKKQRESKIAKGEWCPELKNGSTFFNSGYVDYLDANYHEPKREGTYAW